jgi:transcription elongation factor Elf1
MYLRDATCLFCLNTSTARLGLDKKQRPYLHCVACGVRAFMPLYECLNGLAILPALVDAWRKTTSEEARRGHLAHYLNDLRSRAREANTAPAPTADAALAAALEKVA